MTAPRIFPPLDGQILAQQLEAIRLSLDFDADYLNDVRCPYPEKLKTFLRRLVIPSQVNSRDLADGVFRHGQTDEDKVESLMTEVQLTINQMKKLSEDMGRDGDSSERMGFLKNYAPLMERFLNLLEKAQGQKSMFEFQRVVLGVMEEVLNKDQRLELKNRLKKANVPDVRDPSEDLKDLVLRDA